MKGVNRRSRCNRRRERRVAAAVDAVRRGQRALVVLRSGGPRVVPRLRCLCRSAKSQLTVMTTQKSSAWTESVAWSRSSCVTRERAGCAL
jgi:hypothetical protein